MDRTIFLRENLREAILDLLWGQWTAAGLAGMREVSVALIDPEALLVASMSLARYDARLFDEILDWLAKNSPLLDLSRLRRIAALSTQRERVLLRLAVETAAVQETAPNFQRLFSGDQYAPRRTAAEPEALFFSQEGQEATWTGRDPVFEAAGFLRSPVVLRGFSGHPKTKNQVCLRFQVRGLVGQGSRAEVLTYLLTHEWTHGRRVAERSAYGQSPVASYLASLLEAGLADRRDEGKRVLYRLSGVLGNAFPDRPLFVDWIRVWPALAGILQALRSTESSEQAAWVRLGQVLTKHQDALGTEGFGVEIGDLRGWALQGSAILELAVKRVTARVAELAA